MDPRWIGGPQGLLGYETLAYIRREPAGERSLRLGVQRRTFPNQQEVQERNQWWLLRRGPARNTQQIQHL